MRLPRFRFTVRWMMVVVVAALAPISVKGDQRSPEVSYFPEGVFDSEDKERNAFWDKVYTKALRAMGEPSLLKVAEDDQAVSVYRLLWVSSFHHRISVRIVKSGETFMLHAVELGGKGGPDPGKIAIKKSVKLTEDQWTWLLVHITRARFWKMPTCVKRRPGDGVLTDGDHLVCEGVEDGKYHVVDRSDPDLIYETVCWYMLSLSGLDVREAWLSYHGDEAFKEVGK